MELKVLERGRKERERLEEEDGEKGERNHAFGLRHVASI